MRRALIVTTAAAIIGIAVVVALDDGPRESARPTASGAASSSPVAPTTPTGGCVVVDGAIQAAIDAAPPDTSFCLSGRYEITAPLHPKDGQRFVGPAEITAAGSVHTGFELKGTGSGLDVTAADVTLVDLDIHGFELRGVECWSGTTILGGRLHDNGRNGLGCGLDYVAGRVLVEGVEIDRNGSPDQLGRGASGIKIARLGAGRLSYVSTPAFMSPTSRSRTASRRGTGGRARSAGFTVRLLHRRGIPVTPQRLPA